MSDTFNFTAIQGSNTLDFDATGTIIGSFEFIGEVNETGPAGPGISVDSSLLEAAADPESIIFGTITRDVDGTAISASVTWPDGIVGTYTGVPDSDFPGAISGYTITHNAAIYTQPTMTRDESGAVTTRPAIVVTP